MHGEEIFDWPASCPRWFRYHVCHSLVMCHACCCGKQAGQAAHKALNRYSSWSSRLRNGCKQRQEQQSAAWAWHHELRTSLVQLSSSLPNWNNPLPHLSSIHKHNTQATLACLDTNTRARTRTSICFYALVRLCYGHKHRTQTSCGTCIHASYECGYPGNSSQNGNAGVQRGWCT